MVDTLYTSDGRKFVVSNKHKIIIVTYNKKYADYVEHMLKQRDYDETYFLNIYKK